MKKSALSALFAVSLFAAAQAQTIHTELDGRALTFDQPPAMVNGRVMVPLRGIFENLGAQVRFEPAGQTITATRGSRVVRLALGSTQAHVDNRTVTLDVPAGTVGGRTMVPLRFVSEALGAEVHWQEATQTVAISSNNGSNQSNAPAPAPPPVVQQQNRTTLTSVMHNAQGPLHGGDRLQVNATGDPRGKATFDIVGVSQGQPMREVQPGEYLGEFTVPNGLRVQQARVVVHLRKGRETAALQGPQVVSFDAQRPGRPQQAGVGNLNVRVSNLAPGAQVSPVFNVQGQTTPNATVHVSARSNRALIPGVINLKNQTLQGQAQADAQGRFDVQLNASAIPAGSPMTLKVTASDPSGRQGPPVQLNISRK